MASAPYDRFLSSDQDTNQFLVRRRLNPKSLIQLSETLLVELTRIYGPLMSKSSLKKKKLHLGWVKKVLAFLFLFFNV